MLLNKRNWVRKNVNYHLWKAAKRRSKEYGLEFSITKEDIAIPELCPVFKVPFEFGHKQLAASLDRLDSDKGYTKDNIQVISVLANRMKNNATKEQLKLFAEWVQNG